MSVQYSGDKITFADGSIVGSGWSGFKNRILNGDMRIDQRNAGASVTVASGTYSVDRYIYFASQASKFTAGQNLNSVTPPAGFSNYLGFQVASAVSIGASDTFQFQQRIEGFNFADMAWGTANASSVTLSFKVYSSLTGTFGGALRNSADNRSYPFTYTISSANTWTTATVTIAGDTSGTWVGATNGIGVKVIFGLGEGSSNCGTAGAWASAAYSGATGQVSVVGTSGATFYITGVQLEKGSTATSFDYRPYGTELALCQRYYWKNDSTANFAALASGLAQTTTSARVYMKYPAEMRTQPSMSYNGTITVNDATDRNITAIGAAYTSTSSVMLDLTVTTVLTVGRGVVVYKGNTSSDYIQASAEL